MAALAFAPWAYGCTVPWSRHLLTWLLLAATVSFLLALACERRRPRVPPLAGLMTLGIVALGWWMVANAYGHFDVETFVFAERKPLWNGAPGTVDRAASLPAVLLATGLVGAFWIACDMMAGSRWRSRMGFCLALLGASIVALGIAQKATEARAIFWQWGGDSGPTFFATFRYHANAGAFVNIVLPFILAQAALAFRQSASQGVRAFWCLAALVAAASTFLSASRAAMVITCLILAGFLLWQVLDATSRGRRWALGIALGAAAALIVFVAVAARPGALWDRWLGDAANLVENRRYTVYESIITEALPVSGWRGFGPGTFEITFPYFTNHLGGRLEGIWRYAHQDYLQAVMEWGFIGAFLWGGFLVAALGRGWALLARRADRAAVEDRLLAGAAFLALAGVMLHALVDFPFQIASIELYAILVAALLWKTPLRVRTRVKTRVAAGAGANPSAEPAL